MKVEINFNFTLFIDKETKNTFSLGANHSLKKYVLNNSENSLISKMISIDKNTFDSFFLCENLEIKTTYKQTLIIKK